MKTFYVTIAANMPMGCPEGRWSFMYSTLEDVHPMDRKRHGCNRDAEAFHAACQDEASRCMRTEHENEKLRANNNSNNNNKEDGK